MSEEHEQTGSGTLFDDEFLGIMTDWTRRAGAFLLGRKTHEMFAASWPKSTDPADEIAAALNTRPKFVASRTLDKVTWNNSHLLEGNVSDEVAKLKTQEGGETKSMAAVSSSKPSSSTI